MEQLREEGDYNNQDKFKKVYRGAYTYQSKGVPYTEETFEVYKSKKEYSLDFLVETLTRVSTGELLKTQILYRANKDFVPTKVEVHKNLGKETVEEVFRFDNKKNILTYTFRNKYGREKVEMNTPPRFHLSVPAACCSMLYILSKKFDATGKNFYSIIQSLNQWSYEQPLVSKNIAVERLSLTSETIYVDGQELQAVQYKVYEDIKTDEQNFIAPPAIKVFLSRHQSIPYFIESPDGAKVQVKYLNALDDDE